MDLIRESSFAQYLIEQEIEENKEQWLKQGIEQGIEQGERKSTLAGILEVLEIRFDLSEAHPLSGRIADIDDLQRNAATHLKTKEDIAAYLEAVLKDGDPRLITAALGDIACAKGMTQIARETGLGCTSLYKALSPEGNPGFATVLKVIHALGFRLHAIPI